MRNVSLEAAILSTIIALNAGHPDQIIAVRDITPLRGATQLSSQKDGLAAL